MRWRGGRGWAKQCARGPPSAPATAPRPETAARLLNKRAVRRCTDGGGGGPTTISERATIDTSTLHPRPPPLFLSLFPLGSHTVLALLDSGYTATVFDNLDNSFEAVFDRMKELAGDKAGSMKFVKVRGAKKKKKKT